MKSVIIIEPDKYLRLALETWFRQANVNVLTADDENTVSLMLEEDEADLILLDTMDMEVAVEKILIKLKAHSEWQAIPTLVIAADQKQSEQIEKLGATLVVEKQNLDLASLVEKAIKLTH